MSFESMGKGSIETNSNRSHGECERHGCTSACQTNQCRVSCPNFHPFHGVFHPSSVKVEYLVLRLTSHSQSPKSADAAEIAAIFRDLGWFAELNNEDFAFDHTRYSARNLVFDFRIRFQRATKHQPEGRSGFTMTNRPDANLG